MEDSLQDFTDILKNKKRYSEVMKVSSDIKHNFGLGQVSQSLN